MVLEDIDTTFPDMDILKILKIITILLILLITLYSYIMNAGPHATIAQYEHLPDDIFAHYIPIFYPEIPPYYDGLHNLVGLYRLSRRAFEEEIARLKELL